MKRACIDFGSTKNNICDKVTDHRNRRNYLASHPIAGTENRSKNQHFQVYLMIKQLFCVTLKRQIKNY